MSEELKAKLEAKKAEVAKLKEAVGADKSSVPAKLDYIIGLLELQRITDPPTDPTGT